MQNHFNRMDDVPETFKLYFQKKIEPLKVRLSMVEEVLAEQEGPRLAQELCIAFVAVLRVKSEYGFRHGVSSDFISQQEASTLQQVLKLNEPLFMDELRSATQESTSSSRRR